MDHTADIGTTLSTTKGGLLRPPPPADHYWQYCVTCGTKLEGRKCKLICPKCGFYHSCSEP